MQSAENMTASGSVECLCWVPVDPGCTRQWSQRNVRYPSKIIPYYSTDYLLRTTDCYVHTYVDRIYRTRREGNPEALPLLSRPTLLLVAQRPSWLPRPLVVAENQAVGAFTSQWSISLSLFIPWMFVSTNHLCSEPTFHTLNGLSSTPVSHQ